MGILDILKGLLVIVLFWIATIIVFVIGISIVPIVMYILGINS